MSIVDITSGVTYASIAAAVTGSVAGDTLRIGAGTYAENIPKLKHALTLEANGAVTLTPPAAGLANDEGILVIDADVTVIGIAFTGAAGPSGNDAGIRFETGNLTITDSHFYGNQDGLLANAEAGATISIDGSEFDHNGIEDGFTHNLYVNEIGTLSITNSYFHDALGGHEIKSRADNTIISGSTISDGTSDGSYDIDLPDGGMAGITGNTIVKGASSGNWNVLHFGGEGTPDPVDPLLSVVYANSSLTFENNIVSSLLPAEDAHPLLFDAAGDGAGHTILPVISGNTFENIPASQLVKASNGSDFSYLAPDAYAADNTFVACFAAGTRIASEHGEVAVEALREGDRVVSAFGGVVPVVWVGRRIVDCRRHPRPLAVCPIRVRKDAFADGWPARDLLLSPDHAVFVRDVLIPVRYLVNGTTIVRVPMAAVTYFHVELPLHGVILAEGLPVESYLDTGNRGAFANGGTVAHIHPDFAQAVWHAEACAPMITHGPLLEAVVQAVGARARMRAAPLAEGCAA